MKSLTKLNLVIMAFMISSIGFSQTFTMGKKCRAKLEVAQQALEQEKYNEALENYNAFNEKCRTKDAQEIGAYGKADVLNHLGRFNDAIVEADKALKVTKETSINAYFQKAIALHGLGKDNEAKDVFAQVIRLTEKNEDVKSRASNYALMAAYYERSEKNTNIAQDYLDKAKELDPENIDYLIQEGGMYSIVGNFNKAMKSYEAAEAIDANSKDLYIAKSNARLKQMDRKYGTVKAQELRGKMTSKEKDELCSDLKRAVELGYKDMNKEMFIALICK